MKRLLTGLAFVACTLLAVCAPTEREGLAKLSWMAGHWSGTDSGVEMEEAWLAPKGGVMLGVHRDVASKEDKLMSFEYLRIEQRESALIYVASPSGKGAVEFTLSKSEENSAIFENPKHDFPKRIIYQRIDDTLHARIEGDEGKSIAWEWELRD